MASKSRHARRELFAISLEMTFKRGCQSFPCYGVTRHDLTGADFCKMWRCRSVALLVAAHTSSTSD